ncbi:hypothetical protein QE374_001502 [Microbacterium sp. SORGH_AS428]|uniref:DUF4260 family protein n=1 Tax=Microbacterium sp. SORGH_AS_0428 TaxID=3041788 RepID=UPI00285EEE01|nr:DUF4260 family protein [Microbacterium sp. SORGH_AS_0428]MDR6199593.1 hypothetical protein [Microbacterium sp. SORGH_AS_0428]
MSTAAHHRATVPSTPVPLLHRVEGAAIAVATVVVFVTAGFAWWWLAALFLLFDVSMLGYAFGIRIGALVYNLGHNYAAPLALLGLYAALAAAGIATPALAVIAACWLFHVGADRALGYGPRPRAWADAGATAAR